MDPSTIALLVGLGTLIIERLYTWIMKIKSSKCCGGDIEFQQAPS